jgi:hypothetical protein
VDVARVVIEDDDDEENGAGEEADGLAPDDAPVEDSADEES